MKGVLPIIARITITKITKQNISVGFAMIYQVMNLITACSTDTALRDIPDLMDKGILVKEDAGGRSTSYVLSEDFG